MIAIFWTLLGLVVYCYFGYPLLIWFCSRIQIKTVEKRYATPSVSIVLSVWNEEDVIEQKLDNLIGLDYPLEKLEIVIGSDGSTDRTNEIIRQFNQNNIHLIDRPERGGKMSMLNELVSRATNEVIVFTDARQLFAKGAIKELVANFSDERVGCVSGELMFSRKEGATAKGVNLYWDYEKFIRHCESDVHSMLGATGAIYAIRKELYSDIPTSVVLDDMFVPLKIIQKGYRAIFDSTAKAYDEVADSPREEHRRKARTLYGNYQIFGLFKNMFNPKKSPVAIQMFSHKFLRVMVPFLLIGVFVINALLLNHTFFQWMMTLQVMFYIMAISGALARYKKYGILNIVSKICYIPYVFCLLNFSALVGFLRFTGSAQDVTWVKARTE